MVGGLNMAIAIIDNASDTPAIQCFNKLIEVTNKRFTYHIPAWQGIESVQRLKSTPEALFLLGSYSNVEDRFEWQKHVAEYARNALEKGIPVLGICFGHQLMADSYGGEGGRIDSGGTHKLTRRFETEDDAFTFVVEHSFEIKRLPKDFVVKGTSPACKYDFVAHSKLPYWGVQGHPEASWDFVEDTQEDGLSLAEYNLATRDGERFIQTFINQFLS